MRPALLTVCLLACVPAVAQNSQLICEVTAEPRQVRAEGVSELVGVIVLPCRGTPGAAVTGSFSLISSAPVTNKIANDRIDAVMTAETAAGTQTVGGSPYLGGLNTIAFGAYSFTMPASGRTTFTFGNIRVNPVNGDNVTMFISTTSGAVAITNSRPVVGIVLRGLYAGGSSARIVCVGSPLPEDPTFLSLVWGGTQFATMRVTEGFPNAFESKQANATNGTRIFIRLSGFPVRARVFVPDFVTGSSSASPTSAGDLGVGPSAGTYSGGGLLFARVPNSDIQGAGGFPPLIGGGVTIFNSVSEVNLISGTGWITYEVIDAAASALESAQIPLFIALPANSGQDGTVASARLTFGPLSTANEASNSAPVVRFRDVAPQQDCNILRDCNAGYFPKLLVDVEQTLAVSAPPVAGFYQRSMRIINDSGGIMPWSTSIQYKNGADWLKLIPSSGIGNARAILNFYPEKLKPGFYEATLVIDAGPVAGQRTLTVRLDVTTPPPGPVTPPPDPTPPPNRPRFWGVGNPANLGIQTVAPGSLAVIDGTKLGGKSVEVRFDGIAAQVLSASDARIVVIVPADLGTKAEAQVEVSVDGVVSESAKVALAIAAPAIFQGAVYNEDGFPNAASNPERSGHILQIFASGLPHPSLGIISARIHDREVTAPAFAGPAPGSPGVQQVNLRIPDDLPPMNSEVRVCGAPLTAPSQVVCSAGMPIAIREP